MRKKFNDTGLCVPDRHYTVDTSAASEVSVEFANSIIHCRERSAYFEHIFAVWV
ncbi:MAG: hypothetical protein GY795_19780 [Desulfobacterales bacterium]|nr:hypothetical protein [Desulfobacterales bacterium]